MKEIAEFVIRLSHSDSKIQYAGKRKGEEFDAIVKADIETLKPLRYSEADMVSLEMGINLTIDWYRQNYTKRSS